MIMITFCFVTEKLIFTLFCFISQLLNANSDRSSVVVSMFSSPFAAQFVRILPKNHSAHCMRVDLFGCRDCKCCIQYSVFIIIRVLLFI